MKDRSMHVCIYIS